MKKAVIVDFDLTLVKVNSFELFYKELAKYFIQSLHINYFVFLLYLILLRKTRLITHATLKKKTLFFIENVDINSFISIFIEKLSTFLDYDVVDYIHKYRCEGYVCYLCTAAPEMYIIPFLKNTKLEFDEVICSAQPQKDLEWKENLGNAKKESTMKALKKRGETLAVLLTDHRDDMPLLKIRKEKNILIHPSIHTIEEVEKEHIEYDVL